MALLAALMAALRLDFPCGAALTVSVSLSHTLSIFPSSHVFGFPTISPGFRPDRHPRPRARASLCGYSRSFAMSSAQLRDQTRTWFPMDVIGCHSPGAGAEIPDAYPDTTLPENTNSNKQTLLEIHYTLNSKLNKTKPHMSHATHLL